MPKCKICGDEDKVPVMVGLCDRCYVLDSRLPELNPQAQDYFYERLKLLIEERKGK